MFCATSSRHWVSNQLISLTVYNSNVVGSLRSGDDLSLETAQAVSDRSSQREIYMKRDKTKSQQLGTSLCVYTCV